MIDDGYVIYWVIRYYIGNVLIYKEKVFDPLKITIHISDFTAGISKVTDIKYKQYKFEILKTIPLGYKLPKGYNTLMINHRGSYVIGDFLNGFLIKFKVLKDGEI